MRMLRDLLCRRRLTVIGGHHLIVSVGLMLMMSKVLRGSSGLMHAIGADRTPGELECEHHQHANEKTARHGREYSIGAVIRCCHADVRVADACH